jgi:hypothetical protein
VDTGPSCAQRGGGEFKAVGERDQGCGVDTGPSSAQRGGGEFKAVGDLNSSAIRGARQRRRRRRPARAATDGSRDVPLVEKALFGANANKEDAAAPHTLRPTVSATCPWSRKSQTQTQTQTQTQS